MKQNADYKKVIANVVSNLREQRAKPSVFIETTTRTVSQPTLDELLDRLGCPTKNIEEFKSFLSLLDSVNQLAIVLNQKSRP